MCIQEISEKGAFDDMPEDDLADAISGPKDAAKLAADMPTAAFTEKCPKCRGRGQFVSYSGRLLGECFACKGKGTVTFKTSSAQRRQARDNRASTATRKVAKHIEDFSAQHPEVFAWMQANPNFDFAKSLLDAVGKWGHLTENQLAAAHRSIEKRKVAQQATADRIASAPVVDTTKIEAAFAKASSVLKSPKLRAAGLVFSFAKAASKNAGALYVQSAERTNAEGERLYLGKIMGGKFIASRDCSTEDQQRLLDVATDPLGAAISYGRLTGSCACCGRPLENAESVARGIGPVCAEKFGWGG